MSSPKVDYESLTLSQYAHLRSLIPAGFKTVRKAPLDVEKVIKEETERRGRVKERARRRELEDELGSAAAGPSKPTLSHSVAQKLLPSSKPIPSSFPNAPPPDSTSSSDEGESRTTVVAKKRKIENDVLSGKKKKKRAAEGANGKEKEPTISNPFKMSQTPLPISTTLFPPSNGPLVPYADSSPPSSRAQTPLPTSASLLPALPLTAPKPRADDSHSSDEDDDENETTPGNSVNSTPTISLNTPTTKADAKKEKARRKKIKRKEKKARERMEREAQGGVGGVGGELGEAVGEAVRGGDGDEEDE